MNRAVSALYEPGSVFKVVTLSAAIESADHMRLGLQELQVKSGKQTITLTCSFGVSQWEPDDSIDRLLRRADMALYKAKMSGRNCVSSTCSVSEVPNYDSLSSVIRSDARDVQLPHSDQTPVSAPG